ncbi:DHA2 family efflux MFS transporter permease subunit [soil metagenome]
MSDAAPPKAALPPLTGGALVLGTISLSLATFMNVLDTSIANVSLPTISGDLGVSTQQGTWVITSFAVANAISVPLTGWLTQRIGMVKLFVSSILLFVLASWMCGFAPSIELLILFRVIQGAVAGPMIPLSQSLLLSSYPKARAGSALAMWSITTLVAPVVGPLLGGWITDNITWPWIFYINVPVGIAAAGVTWFIYKDRETPTRVLPIDKIGLALLVVWVAAMQITLDKGKELDWFNSGFIVSLTCIAVLGFTLFLAWELTEKHPVVDLTLFTRRNFWVGTLSISLGYGLYFGNVVLLPLWLQQEMGYTATLAGLALAPVGLLAIVFSPFVGKRVGTWDPRKMATFSFIVLAAVFWMRSKFSTDVSFETILIPTLIQGLGLAFFFIPLVTLTLSGLTPDRIPAATGLSNFVRITAGAIGTSVSTTVWDNRATLHHSQLAESINNASPTAVATLADLQARGLSHDQALGDINRLIDQQAFTMAATDIFRAGAFMFLVVIAFVWIARPARGGGSADAAAGAH